MTAGSPRPDSSEDASARLAALERQRLADRLHNEFLQLVTGISLQAKTLEKLAARRGADAAEAAQIGKAANGLSRRMRGLVAELRGSVLEAGLRPALRELALDLAAAHGAAVRLDVRELPRAGGEAELHLYAMAREAMTIALRYREATQLSVSARTFGATLALRIGDNGLPPDDERCRVAAASSDDYLLLRARALGGSVRVSPRAGGGTSIIITASYIPGEPDQP
ncbi:MAG TPA: histidine kinase [Rhodocyclaceae bacterium]